MKPSSRTLSAASLLFLLILTGCNRGKSDETALPDLTLPRQSVIFTVLLEKTQQLLSRPAASLGVYVTRYLSSDSSILSQSADKGITALMALTAERSPLEDDDTFALLEEYGALLQVNIPDMLNRSADRPTTLNHYTSDLANITIRAQEKFKELAARSELLRTRQREAATRVNQVERTISTAIREHDYITAGEEQRSLVEARTELTTVETEQKQLRDIQKTYEDLMVIAQRRLTAIAQNREVLIAGLKVVEVPGVEDLNILLQNRSNRRQRNTGIGL